MQGDDPFDPSSLTALVLDENPNARAISVDLLRAMGFRRVLGATYAAEAWELLRKANPDIVLIEWQGGAAAGLDFVRRVRTGEDIPNRAVSIFMLTSRGAQADVETARRAGVDGYLRKPISPLALQKRVKTALVNPQPFVATASYAGPCRRRPRPDLNYSGPWRRIGDSAPSAPEDDCEGDVMVELARARVAVLEASVRALAPGDANAARIVYKAAQGLIEIAEQIGDTALGLGAKEMARYLQAQGATDRLDRNVVQTHVAALHQLVHLPHALGQERERVAQSLKRMVDKKLRQTAA